jgi:hypothetical protein
MMRALRIRIRRSNEGQPLCHLYIQLPSVLIRHYLPQYSRLISCVLVNTARFNQFINLNWHHLG